MPNYFCNAVKRLINNRQMSRRAWLNSDDGYTLPSVILNFYFMIDFIMTFYSGQLIIGDVICKNHVGNMYTRLITRLRHKRT